MLLGAPEAYILSRMQAPWRSIFLLVILAPLLVSVVVRAFGWSLVLGPAGFVNQAFEAVGIGRVRMLYTPIAVVVALVHVMLPFMVIPVWTSLQKLDPQVENAALSLGASRFTVLAPRGAAAGAARAAVGRPHRLCIERQRAGHSGPAGRPQAEDGGHADLRRVPARTELAAGAAIALALLLVNLAVMATTTALIEGRYRQRMGA